jgi:hypothetical protein
MAAQWKALAETANSELATASFHPFGEHFNHATAELGFRRLQMHHLTSGTIAASESVDLDGSTALLENAAGEMARCVELQSRAMRAFSLYGGALGVIADGPLWAYLDGGPESADPRWQSWAQHKVDALRSTEHATRTLRSAAAWDLAAVDAFAVARSFPDYSPPCIAWLRATQTLAERAVAEAHATSQSEAAMFTALSGQYAAGFLICNP